MNNIIKKIAASGDPGPDFTDVIQLTGLAGVAAGAAAFTTALAALGPGGIVAGVMSLCLVGAIADAIAEYGFDAIARGVIKELYCRGESKESIKRKILKCPISSRLKSSLCDIIEKFS